MDRDDSSPSDEIRISVVIPAYNAARFITAAVDSMLNQTHPPDEIVVVDDGSIDKTPEILAGYGDRIRVVRQDNAGEGPARNTGTKAAKYDWVYYIDSDDVAIPTALADLTAGLRANPDADIVYGAYMRFYPDGEEKVFKMPHPPVGRNLIAETFSDSFFMVGCALLRRKAVIKAGMFNNYLCASDFYCWGRMAPDCCFAYVDAVIMKYRMHDEQISKRTIKMAYYHYKAQRSLLKLYRRRKIHLPREVKRSEMDDRIRYLAMRMYWRRDGYATCLVFLWALLLYPLDLKLWGYFFVSLIPTPLLKCIDRFR
ncbi:MAG: glycosyltransferase family 2 protein, partial [Phycisphaerae bacterium]|nr:glycosyltransferase family 2 protein [Phycisphaerae bacterium]